MPKYQKKLQDDLKAAAELLTTWSKNPEEVFVKYGLANDPQQVDVTVDHTKPGRERNAARGSCGCGCAFTVEFEYETDMA